MPKTDTFHPGNWALAYMKVLEGEGGDPADSGYHVGRGDNVSRGYQSESLESLQVLTSWVSSLPGEIFGRSAAAKLEKLIREAAAKAFPEKLPLPPALETAIRLTLLMVKKNVISHAHLIIGEAKKILKKKNGILEVSLESAFNMGDEFEESIKTDLAKKTGAARVELTKKINPELIGGFRLGMEDRLIDASILSQLAKMESFLAEAEGTWAVPVDGGD